AFADDKSVAAGIPRTARMRRIVIARGERLHGGKSPDAHGRDGGFGATANHHFCGAALDNLEGIANAMRGSRTRRGWRGIRPSRPITNRHSSRSQLHAARGTEHRGNLVRAAVQQLSVLALD